MDERGQLDLMEVMGEIPVETNRKSIDIRSENKGLSDSEKDFVKDLGSKRYKSKRAAGISSKRTDGSICLERNDQESTGAEYYAAKRLGGEFNATVTNHGDGGKDFTLTVDGIEVSVDAVWLGFIKDTEKPRHNGNLIINPDEQQRWADIYVVISGSIDLGYCIEGWLTHGELVSMPTKNFGYGKKYACPVDRLHQLPITLA